MWIKNLKKIPYSLLCAITMNIDVTEPTLVILVGTRALLFLAWCILRIFALNILYLGLCVFVVVLLSLIRRCFLEGFCLSHSLAM